MKVKALVMTCLMGSIAVSAYAVTFPPDYEKILWNIEVINCNQNSEAKYDIIFKDARRMPEKNEVPNEQSRYNNDGRMHETKTFSIACGKENNVRQTLEVFEYNGENFEIKQVSGGNLFYKHEICDSQKGTIGSGAYHHKPRENITVQIDASKDTKAITFFHKNKPLPYNKSGDQKLGDLCKNEGWK